VIYLLDVNVLIALIDPAHVAHDDAHHWFQTVGHEAWATSPITENGVIRIVGNPKYPSSPGSPVAVADMMRALRSLPGHHFWHDSISLVETPGLDVAKVLTAGQVTDTYLLALAKSHGGHLATFDRKLSTLSVADGKSALCLIPNA
jgi:toxin-antitoxin system PIN domain toxin